MAVGVERSWQVSEALESSYPGVKVTLSHPVTPPGSLGIVIQTPLLPGPRGRPVALGLNSYE